jgi:kumamolisin
VPDVSALDDPGYLVYVDGVELEVSGTSAVAPVWAALTARVNEGLERPAGFFAPLLYAPAPTGAPAPLRDITRGGEGYYKARPGWDPCTGLGVPVGTALQALLRG